MIDSWGGCMNLCEWVCVCASVLRTAFFLLPFCLFRLCINGHLIWMRIACLVLADPVGIKWHVRVLEILKKCKNPSACLISSAEKSSQQQIARHYLLIRWWLGESRSLHTTSCLAKREPTTIWTKQTLFWMKTLRLLGINRFAINLTI